MSFDHRFDPRWERVLRPALASVQVNGEPLEPHRVDVRMSGDSVLTQILEGLSRCRVVVADITSLGVLDGRVVRNENVFYELGLAQAVRLPEEVLVFRSDGDPIAFDVSNVRVHTYDPDGDPDGARGRVTEVVVGSLTELNVRRHLALRNAADALDAESWMVLAEAQSRAGVSPPARQTMGQALNAGPRLNAISRLLDLTAIRAEYFRFTGQVTEADANAPLVRYRTTTFGAALFEHLVAAMGLDDPQIREHFQRLAAEGGPRNIGELR